LLGDPIAGGATYGTPKSHDEFLKVVDRLMQHYLGADAPEYGDIRYVIDYALYLESELRTSTIGAMP
jgi:hypothetical protein